MEEEKDWVKDFVVKNSDNNDDNYTELALLIKAVNYLNQTHPNVQVLDVIDDCIIFETKKLVTFCYKATNEIEAEQKSREATQKFFIRQMRPHVPPKEVDE